MKPIILYKLDGSPPCRAVMIVGRILGLNFDFIEPNFAENETRQPEFIEKNPMHTIPLLDDRGFLLAESHAITTYLITKFGADRRATLYPSDMYDRATIDSRLHFDSSVLFPRLKDISEGARLYGATGPTEAQIARIEDAYQVLELYLNKTKYLACDHFTVADICAGPTVTALNSVVPVDATNYPKLIDWIGSLHAESAFAEIDPPGVQEWSGFIHSLWNENNNAPEGAQAHGR